MLSDQYNPQFWTEVGETCENLNSNIHLPSDVEAHLHHATTDPHQLCGYRSKLRTTLQAAESLFDPDADASHHKNNLRVLDTTLEAIEGNLQSTVTSLERLLSDLRNSTSCRNHLRYHVEKTEREARNTTSFVEQLILSDSAEAALKQSDPHSNEFKDALNDLSRTLKSCDLNQHSRLAHETHPALLDLRNIAVRRIDNRMSQSLKLMRNSSSSFMVLRETLLRDQKPLLKFLSGHRQSILDSLVREYTEMAKLAFKFYMESYCRLLKADTSNEEMGAWNLSFMGEGTSKALASIWEYASATSDSLQTDRLADGLNTQESHHNKRDMRCEINWRLNDYRDAVRESLTPLEAEFRLQEQAAGHPSYDLLRKLAALFLTFEKNESRFVTETFGDSGATLVSEIFSHKKNPALAFLDETLGALAPESELEQLCICLYVSRHLREHITGQQGFDSRVTFFVVTERMIQTRLVPLLESKAKTAKELLLEAEHKGHTHDEISRFFSFVPSILVIAHEGDKRIRSQDVGHALRRRLHSCVAEVLACARANLQQIDKSGFHIELHLGYVASLLLVLDVSAPDGLQDVFREVRGLVEKSFSQGCESFADTYVARNLQEISQLESTLSGQSLNEATEQITRLMEKLRETAALVTESMVFLENDDVGDSYKEKAVHIVLNCLRVRTETLRNTLSYQPELTHSFDW